MRSTKLRDEANRIERFVRAESPAGNDVSFMRSRKLRRVKGAKKKYEWPNRRCNFP